jgi:hypothetical protein
MLVITLAVAAWIAVLVLAVAVAVAADRGDEALAERNSRGGGMLEATFLLEASALAATPVALFETGNERPELARAAGSHS